MASVLFKNHISFTFYCNFKFRPFLQFIFVCQSRQRHSWPARPPSTDVIRGNYFHFNNQKPISEASSRSAAGAACTVRDLAYEKKKSAAQRQHKLISLTSTGAARSKSPSKYYEEKNIMQHWSCNFSSPRILTKSFFYKNKYKIKKTKSLGLNMHFAALLPDPNHLLQNKNCGSSHKIHEKLLSKPSLQSVSYFHSAHASINTHTRPANSKCKYAPTSANVCSFFGLSGKTLFFLPPHANPAIFFC